MKLSPSNCQLDECEFNFIDPPENSQECVACPYLIDENWQPKIEPKED